MTSSLQCNDSWQIEMEVRMSINIALFWSSVCSCLQAKRLQKPDSYEDVVCAFLAGVFVSFEHYTSILMFLADGIEKR